MKPYAGYSVDFNAFWQYYRGTVRADYSSYRQGFVRCFCACEKKYGISEGFGSNHVNLVGKYLTKICKDTRVMMLSQGIPDVATKSIIDKFKKWFVSYYA